MAQITRNSTPIIHLDMPIPVGGICALIVVFKQGNKVVLKKTIEDVRLDRRREQVSFPLTREETGSLTAYKNVHIQLTAKFSNGTQIPFGETSMYVIDTLTDEEL